MKHLRLSAAFVFVALALASARAHALPKPGASTAAPKPVAFKLDQKPGEVLLKTEAYTLAITTEGFGWTLSRGGSVVLRSAQPDNATPNGVLLFETTPEKPATLTKTTVNADHVVLEYSFKRAKTAMLVELRPYADRVRIVNTGLHRDPPLHSLGTTLRFELASKDGKDGSRWYGGGFQGWRGKLVLPLNDAHIETPGFVAFGKTQASPFWYSTAGVGVWVRTPLDFRYSVNKVPVGADGKPAGKPDGLVSIEMPASALTYDLLIAADVRAIVRTFIDEVGYPAVTPPADYFRLPIYTTWVEHKVPTDQAKVLEYARAIKKNALPAGTIEIDDKWEAKYGDMEFDATKFPDPKAMVAEIHKMGMKVTLWVHPFVNTDSATFEKLRKQPGSAEAKKLLHDGTGNIGIINWWNGNAAVWDMSYAPAAAEFRAKLKRLQSRYGIDGFKFDGGDSEMVPQEARSFDGKDPIEYCDVYNREATAKWAWNETRVGIYSQRLGIVQRLIDKHSIWGPENGLQALVPEMIIVSLRGYPYAMPDMIGGNQYNDDKADKELMIRWAQASALMPLIQFSIGPWHFDEETVKLSREASELHVKLSPLIIEMAQAAPKTGEPILASLWYHFPKDTATFGITDQFMLGPDVVVAPVVHKGAVSRDVYLPAGKWRDHASGNVIEGGRLLKAHPAPLQVLPLFVREGSKADKLLAKPVQ